MNVPTNTSSVPKIKKKKIPGSPFKATFTDTAKNKANDYTGPLMTNFVLATLKSLEDYCKTTDAGNLEARTTARPLRQKYSNIRY
jgi:hypothetical protein